MANFSPYTVTVRMLAELVGHGLRSIAFTKARRITERREERGRVAHTCRRRWHGAEMARRSGYTEPRVADNARRAWWRRELRWLHGDGVAQRRLGHVCASSARRIADCRRIVWCATLVLRAGRFTRLVTH